tara:strand:+ start:280 stop:639 length:360 start_codon:yes stop_codon:yes gene_type:complete
MEITGKIIEILPERSGESARGAWRKREYVMEIEGQYSKKICFVVWGDKIDEFAIREGEALLASVDLESREYNGRWYTDVKAWRISRGEDTQTGPVKDNILDEFPSKVTENVVLDDEIPF